MTQTRNSAISDYITSSAVNVRKEKDEKANALGSVEESFAI